MLNTIFSCVTFMTAIIENHFNITGSIGIPTTMMVIKGNNGFDHHLTSVRGLWESLIYRLEAIGFG